MFSIGSRAVDSVVDNFNKLWVLGGGVVAIAAYAVTIKVRLDYLEKHYDKQISALWDKVDELLSKGGE